MSILSGKGFIIDKTSLKDKTLIIKILTDSDEVFSTIFYRGKKGQKTPNHLDLIDYQVIEKKASDFYGCKEILIKQPFVPFSDRETKSDYYFFLAEVIRIIGRRIEVERGLYDLMDYFFQHFRTELSPDLLVTFMLKLLDVFGVLPSLVDGAKYLDFREGRFIFSVPDHPDFCEADSIIASYSLLNENAPFFVHSSSKARLDIILHLIRYFEIQKGIPLSLNSIEILRDLR